MPATDAAVRRVHRAVAALGRGRWLLAVSGGADSMVLLDAAASMLPRESLVVATFHHGSGEWSDRAASLVMSHAAALGITCVVGRAGRESWSRSPTEAHWRAARWRFLTETARRAAATVATAHTEDDQVETVFMRLLRGTGPRGLVALYADGPVRRPLLRLPRTVIATYAAGRSIPYLNDPANTDRRHLRTRVRLDHLPAIDAVRPTFRSELLALARRAARWRRQMEAAALKFPVMDAPPGHTAFARAPLREYSDDALRVLWPALAARAGVVMDRRGTERLAAFTIGGATGKSIQLAGGATVRLERDAVVLCAPGCRAPEATGGGR